MFNKKIDVLTPFLNAGKNRTETMLVQLDGFLYNRSAAFVVAMISDYDRWIKDYPSLSMFKGMNAQQIYKATMYHNPLDVITSLIDPKHIEPGKEDFEFIINSIKVLDGFDMRKGLVMPLVAYALTQIALERCCAKIYISKSTPFTKYEEDYLRNIFASSLNKIELIIGDFFSIWYEKKDELTLSFINNLSVIEPIEKFVIDNKFSSINNQLFLLRINGKIIDIDENNNPSYNCGERIKELESKKIHVGTISAEAYPQQIGSNNIHNYSLTILAKGDYNHEIQHEYC